jgi:hypothetical protein
VHDQNGIEQGHQTGLNRNVKQQGEINGRTFSIFDDGSIEVETGQGIQRFKSFAELNAAASRNGQARQVPPSQ